MSNATLTESGHFVHLAHRVHYDCCVGVTSKRGQGVSVYVKIDAQQHMTGMRGVEETRFQRTENTGKIWKSEQNTIRY